MNATALPTATQSSSSSRSLAVFCRNLSAGRTLYLNIFLSTPQSTLEWSFGRLPPTARSQSPPQPMQRSRCWLVTASSTYWSTIPSTPSRHQSQDKSSVQLPGSPCSGRGRGRKRYPATASCARHAWQPAVVRPHPSYGTLPLEDADVSSIPGACSRLSLLLPGLSGVVGCSALGV
jgi:hypothetical protein